MDHSTDDTAVDQGPTDRLEQQIAFILQLDELKRVTRRAYLLHDDRRENSAEHSWHVALMALVLAEHADEPIDRERVMKMLMIHDIVEIDAGDVPVFDTAARAAKVKDELRAADRLFGLLPPELGMELHALWSEYEHQSSADARFAKAMDRLMPLLHNARGGGRTWRELGIREQQVREINEPITRASRVLGAFMTATVDTAVAEGLLRDTED